MDAGGLIVGLGNPGPEYDRTRHNLGYLALDALMRSLEGQPRAGLAAARTEKGLYAAWRATIGRGRWLLAKPLTYMNRSGQAVASICHYFRIETDQILVVHDELDLPLGRLRLKLGGGTAGHRGLESIAQHLGSRDFYRLRLGIGKPAHGNTADFVLARFGSREAQLADEVTAAAVKSLECFCGTGFEAARQLAGSFRSPLEPEEQASSPG